MSLLSAEDNLQNAARFVEDLHSQRKRAARRFFLLYALLTLAGAGWLVFVVTQVANANGKVVAAEGTLKGVNENLTKQQNKVKGLDKNLQAKAQALHDKNASLEDVSKQLEEKWEKLRQVNEVVGNAKTGCAVKLQALDNIVLLDGTTAAYDFWQQGYAKYNAKDYDGALRLYERSIKEAPAYAPPYNSIGRIYYDQKDYVQAESWYKWALERRANYAPAHHNMALIAKRRGDFPLACKWSKSALAARKGYPQAETFRRRLAAEGHGCDP